MLSSRNGFENWSDGSQLAFRTYYSHDGRPVETADIVVPAVHCEIVYEIPINR